ncbi:MAG: transglycosylase SLT domain-containing protein [Lewinellaceae bacterium]|nr:transglycosylase SLT domain-containing protein [Lewinellaceae bacterium]
MKIPWTLIAMLVLSTAMAKNEGVHAPPVTPANHYEDYWSSQTEEVVKERLGRLDLPMEFTTDRTVLTRIKQYVTLGKVETEAILGRTELFFPIFEQYLRKYNLPEELKYLPMIESGLDATARSGAGAVGTWQLMSITARHFDLAVNGYIDERLDVYRSTEAAAKLLRYLYDQFGDWSLVLVAYNSGPGKVQSAIRSANSSSYARVKNYLPRETQVYVPAYVAAAYIAKYHRQHQLIPRKPKYAREGVRTLRVYKQLSFLEIARVTGMSATDIAQLNPAFRQKLIPRSQQGYFLRLPESAMSALRKHLNADKIDAVAGLMRTTYLVSKGDNLEKIAQLFQTTPKQIMEWNNLHATEVVVSQELQLFLPKSFFLNRV